MLLKNSHSSPLSFSLLTISFLFCSLVEAISPQRQSEFDRYAESKISPSYSYLHGMLTGRVKTSSDRLADAVRKRNDEMQKIIAEEHKFREALEIPYPITAYEKEVRKMTRHEVARKFESYDAERERIRRMYDKGEITDWYENLAHYLNQTIKLRDDCIALIRNESSVFPESLGIRYFDKGEMGAYLASFLSWEAKVKREIDPEIEKARGVLSAAAGYVGKDQAATLSDIRDTMRKAEQQRRQDAQLDRIFTQREKEAEEQRKQEETQREYERLKREAEEENRPMREAAEKSIADAEKQLKQRQAELERDEKELKQMEKSNVSSPKKKSSLEDAMGW